MNLKSKLVLVGTLAAASVWAQAVPRQVAFTANLSSSGLPATGTHSFVFTLFDAVTGGTSAWTETQGTLPVNNGLVFTRLGVTTPLTPTILNGAPLWLEVSVDGTVLSPRSPIASVPYAIRAGVATSAETLGALLPSELQKRVLGTCLGPSAMQSIDADGGVSCVSIAGGTGDITSVTTAPTSGLMGGVLSGDAALSLASCPINQILKSTGMGWSCQVDANSGGTVTSVGAGAGLTGGPITAAGALAVNFGAAAGTVTQGNDSRLPPAPSGAGRMLYDNGSAWVQVPAGAANSVLVGGPAPSFSTATGITSVGTLSSVNVSGTATVGSLAFASPKTSYLNVHASAFFPIRSSDGYTTATHCCGNDRSYVAAAGIASGLAAPIQIPQGAVPVSLSCRVYDASASYDVTVRLVEAVNGNAYCSSTTMGTSPAYQVLSAACGLGPVDNNALSFWLSVLNDGACGTNCAIKSCTLAYTITGLP